MQHSGYRFRSDTSNLLHTRRLWTYRMEARVSDDLWQASEQLRNGHQFGSQKHTGGVLAAGMMHGGRVRIERPLRACLRRLVVATPVVVLSRRGVNPSAETDPVSVAHRTRRDLHSARTFMRMVPATPADAVNQHHEKHRTVRESGHEPILRGQLYFMILGEVISRFKRSFQIPTATHVCTRGTWLPTENSLRMNQCVAVAGPALSGNREATRVSCGYIGSRLIDTSGRVLSVMRSSRSGEWSWRSRQRGFLDVTS